MFNNDHKNYQFFKCWHRILLDGCFDFDIMHVCEMNTKYTALRDNLPLLISAQTTRFLAPKFHVSQCTFIQIFSGFFTLLFIDIFTGRFYKKTVLKNLVQILKYKIYVLELCISVIQYSKKKSFLYIAVLEYKLFFVQSLNI